MVHFSIFRNLISFHVVANYEFEPYNYEKGHICGPLIPTLGTEAVPAKKAATGDVAAHDAANSAFARCEVAVSATVSASIFTRETASAFRCCCCCSGVTTNPTRSWAISRMWQTLQNDSTHNRFRFSRHSMVERDGIWKACKWVGQNGQDCDFLTMRALFIRISVCHTWMQILSSVAIVRIEAACH